MSGFSETSLTVKLSELNPSAPSIQGVSLWLLHHRKHYQTSVKVWYKELGNTKNERKLTMLYLANDVVQNARKKYPEIPKEFGTVMRSVFSHLAALQLDHKTEASLDRLVKIWKERQIFDKKVTLDIEKVWGKRARLSAKARARSSPSSPPPSKKERKHSPLPPSPSPNKEPLSDLFSDSEDPPPPLSEELNSHCDTNGQTSPSFPPDSDDLISALQQLEASASSDATVRELIAKLPPDMSDLSSVSNISSEDQARDQLKQLETASSLLVEYNKRLQEELRDRTRVGRMVADFLTAQKDLLVQTEERLDVYRDKLDKVNQVRTELEAHLASLPDIPTLPTQADTLPSTEKLFTG
eukprot:GFUD01012879.1.p1 GENE.GFUD01012879.1~~GFUD01012879.1.p1  ORF type:complete len:354 (-),score=137.09 GFUD01012879.1:105-1166(-)